MAREDDPLQLPNTPVYGDIVPPFSTRRDYADECLNHSCGGMPRKTQNEGEVHAID